VFAENGQFALDRLDRLEPDFIILDMMMPLLDGFETCTAIRLNPAYKNTPIFMLSGYNSRENITRSYEAGVSMFLPKPIDPERLAKNVDLFFERTPPVWRQKQFPIEQLQTLDDPNKRRQLANPFPPDGELVPPAPEQPRPAQPVDNTPQQTNIPRILVLEDDPSLMELLEMQLSDVFEVVQAKNGMEGMEKAAKFVPDMFLLDVMVPQINGYRLCQMLRNNEVFATTPIIIKTAKQSSREKDFAAKMGANAFLAKPFDMDELLETCLSFTKKPGFQIRPKKNAVLPPMPATMEMLAARGAFDREDSQERAREKMKNKPHVFDPENTPHE
jgi:DNA-binding response OmpR family regulator